MKEKYTGLTLKVLLGYVLLVIIALISIFSILGMINRATTGDYPDKDTRLKLYLVTNTLSLLSESSVIGQPIGMTQNDYDLYNDVMNQVQDNLNELRLVLKDSFQIQDIDTIDVLLEIKRQNTIDLFSRWKELNSVLLNDKAVNIDLSDMIQTKIERQDQTEVRDSVVVIPRPRKGFFRRLAEAFNPDRVDTTVVVNIKSIAQSDTLLNAYNPSDTISAFINKIQATALNERRGLSVQLYRKAAELRYNADLINSRINQILRSIEDEELANTIDYMENKNALYEQVSRFLGYVSIVAIILLLFFSVIISRDIARKRYLSRQLEKAKLYAEDLLHKREQLMLTISHDIRAPMASILGHIELMMRNKPDEYQRYYLDNMTTSSKHILQLVNDLLDSYSIESGKLDIKRSAFSVKVLLDDIFTSFKPLAEAKDLQFELVRDDANMRSNYSGDSLRIRQVVGNLLTNAIKFTSKGKVSLIVSVTDNILHLSVKDTGYGIAEEDLENVFGEFTRLKKDSKKEGFGLGLAITLKLVKLMDGELTLNSVVGEGSEFIMTLPLEETGSIIETNSEQREDKIESLSELIGREVKCLLVDDDLLQLAFMEEYLKQSGIQIETCTDSNKVLDIIGNIKYDIIISDISMPGLDGFELVKQIRSSDIPGTDKIPVIAMSADIAEEKKEEYLSAGFSGCLNKLQISGLMTLLKDLLAKTLHLDLSSVADFAGDDKGALDSILNTFLEETEKNMVLMDEALVENNREQVAKIAHKMIPVFSMVGANITVQNLRVLEKNDSEMTDEKWKILIFELKGQVSAIMDNLADGMCGI